MKQVLRLATGIKHWVMAAVVLRLLVTATVVVQSLLLAHILVRLFAGAGVRDQWAAFVAIAIAVAVRFGLLWLGAVVEATTAAETKSTLRDRAFGKLAELGPDWTAGARTADVKGAIVEGIESLESYYSRYVPALVGVIVTPLSVLIVVGLRDVWSALTLAIFVVAALVLPPLWSKLLKRRSGELMTAYLGMGATVLDTLQGLVTLKAFGASGRQREHLRRTSYRLVDGWIKIMAVALVVHLIYSIAIIGGTATTIAVAAARTADGGMTVATLFVVLVLSGEVLRAVGVLATSFHASYDATSNAQLLEDLFAATPPAPADSARQHVANLGTDVEWDAVSFAYRESTPVLHDLSLRIEPGETVAVVGPSGAGKSTLASLLLHFVDPQSGRVRIGGHDVRELSPDQLHSTVSLVAQDTYLFGGSVRDNIAMARPGATDDDIRAAAAVANADRFIQALPNGYDTEVGERGLLLSGGQRQRIAIARAVLADAPILVLDEATASVDAAAEASIQAALDQVTRNRTTLVIAHRLSTVRNADRIVVLDGGRITEVGRHEELLARAGRYSDLVAAQEA